MLIIYIGHISKSAKWLSLDSYFCFRCCWQQCYDVGNNTAIPADTEKDHLIPYIAHILKVRLAAIDRQLPTFVLGDSGNDTMMPMLPMILACNASL